MANIKISDLISAAAATGTQQFEVNESGVSKKVTGAQIVAYVEGEVSSSPTFTGQTSVPAGTAVAPSVTVTGDSNTGIYFPAADTVAISTGGTLRVSVNSSGSLVTVGDVELGHASDTTLSRSSAGIIAVEGITVPLNSVTNTHTAQQIELGHASDTTISRVSAGVIAVEGQTLATQTYVTNSLSSTIPSGTRMLFQQTAAPTGWTKDTTINNRALRVVSGSVGSGGSLDFDIAFANKSFSGSTSSETVTGTVGSTVLDITQIPDHTHSYSRATAGTTATASGTGTLFLRTISSTSTATGSQGGGLGHTHTFSGGSHAHTFSGAIDMAVKYIDLIIATKD